MSQTGSSGVMVEPVRSRRQRCEFVDLPWQLYRGDENWIPPLRHNQRQLLGFGRHPFHQNAEVATFLAYRAGKACGRIAAIANHAHNRRHQDKVGFCGFFESTNDPDVASGLFDAARNWLADRGLTTLRGPVNPSLNYECGLLVDGFDSPPQLMMTYNRPFYAELFEQYGFRKAQDLYAYWGHVNMVPELSEKHARIHRAVIERFNIHVRPMNPRKFQQDVAAFLDLYNQSLGATWGFVPLSRGEVHRLAGELRHLIVPELTRIAEVDGQPIGALLGLLDFNERVRAIDGRLFPLGWWKLLRNKRAIKRMRFVTANVLPEYQRWGVGLMLTRDFLQPILEFGIQELEFSWVLESNDLSRMTLEKGGARRYKTYRIYDWG